MIPRNIIHLVLKFNTEKFKHTDDSQSDDPNREHEFVKHLQKMGMDT